jgi:Kdo2-lipid IVA lauroyltransferase/acyltransferase
MKKFRRYLYCLAAKIFFNVVQVLPYAFSVKIGGYLGALGYYLIRRARRETLENLRASLKGLDEDEIRRIGRRVFVNQGKNAFELFSFPKLRREDLDKLIEIENKKVFEEALARGKGVLIASAHCGNWEMMGAGLAHLGFPINVIAKKIYLEALNDILVGLRESKGVKVILRSASDSAREILRSLRHNEAIGILIDQDTAVSGVFVDFFSRPAWTPGGLAAIALKTGAGVILALDVRLPDDRHRITIKGPIEMIKSGDKDKDVLENTRIITGMIESHISQYPEQWVWMHKRWKTQKDSDA